MQATSTSSASWLLVLAALAMTGPAAADTITVSPGGPLSSIQEALDQANPGDTIFIKPGTYQDNADGDFARCGLRVATNDLTIKASEDGEVKLIPATDQQEIGIYIAPPSPTAEGRECEADKAADSCPIQLTNFKMEGIIVEGFLKHGIMTRWVNDFEIDNVQSINNRKLGDALLQGNGIYITVSENGIVKNSKSVGSIDTALWVSNGKNVDVESNELMNAAVGLEITVSNQVTCKDNDVHDNTVGVALFHPLGSQNPPLEEMNDWILEDNRIWNNNFPNPATFPTLLSLIPGGIGVLATGVSNHLIIDNDIRDNGSIGVAVSGWCSGLGLSGDTSCGFRDNLFPPPPVGVDNIRVEDNTFTNNGLSPDPAFDLVFGVGGQGVDLVLLYNDQIPLPGLGIVESAEGTCFVDNKKDSGEKASGLGLFGFPPVPFELPSCDDSDSGED